MVMLLVIIIVYINKQLYSQINFRFGEIFNLVPWGNIIRENLILNNTKNIFSFI